MKYHFTLILATLSVFAVLYHFYMLPSFTELSHNIGIISCHNISEQLQDFKCHIVSLDKQIDMDISTDNTANTNNNIYKAYQDSIHYLKNACTINPAFNNEIVVFTHYWLYGTATETDWFDQTCYDGWACFKDVCNSSKELVLTAKYPSAYQELIVTNKDQVYYPFAGLGFIFIIYAIIAGFFFNFDMFMDAYTFIDRSLHDFLCMFDFPGFLVDRRSILYFGELFDEHNNFSIQDKWAFHVDPVDNMRRLSHLRTYTFNHEYFFFNLNILSPGWSIPSYLDLTIVPRLIWPFNYDHFYHTVLWTFY